MSAETALRLGEETWGDRVRRAYYMQREGGLTWMQLAISGSQYLPVSEPTLLKLTKRTAAPSRPRQRATAYLAIRMLGFDPQEFDLRDDDLPVGLRGVI